MKLNSENRKGFTIIELMVSIAIIAVILSVILFNYKKFNSGIVMTNLAYDIALSIRTAQTYGVAAKGVIVGGSSIVFERPYGVYFTTSPNNEYKLFADANTPNDYKYNNSLEAVSTYKIKSPYYIKKFCKIVGTSAPTCTGITTLDVAFKRPDPDARFSINGALENLSEVQIYLGSSGDSTAEKIIKIRPTGQISVE